MKRNKTDVSTTSGKCPTFREFWDAYALKRDRIAAERAWGRLSPKDRIAALGGITAYSEDCKRRGISRMYAQGYINHRRWEDDFANDTSAGQTHPASPVSFSSSQASDVNDLDGMEIW